MVLATAAHPLKSRTIADYEHTFAPYRYSTILFIVISGINLIYVSKVNQHNEMNYIKNEKPFLNTTSIRCDKSQRRPY